jgi:hypothetical protein
MPEVYQCKCGNTTWTIICDEIWCEKCDKKYSIKVPVHPHDFNNNIEKYVVKRQKMMEESEDMKRQQRWYER